MNTTEIIGYSRESLGKQAAKKLRRGGDVPCVLYGGGQQIHFHTPMALLKGLVYTSEASFVRVTIGDAHYQCILQEAQFHPVSEMILHVDFLEIFDDKLLKMQVPTLIQGQAPGVTQGGNLAKKLRKLLVSAYPGDMPAHIPVDVSGLGLGQMVRVRDIEVGRYTILASPAIPVASVEIPRALRSAAGKAAEAADEGK